jgi:hypothetical protein
MVLKLEHFGKYIRNTLNVLKCGALRRLEINWTDRVRNEVLQRAKEERNIVQTVKKKEG